MKPSFAIVGCGRLGINLAVQLHKAGYPVAGLSSKSLDSAEKLGKHIGTDLITNVPWEITVKADLVFITTPDDLIERVCTEIAKRHGLKKNSIVIHCSGLLSSKILNCAKDSGCYAASIHPLQSFAKATYDKNLFEDIFMSVEGDIKALEMAQKIISDLGARSIKIYTETKNLYHAAAVVASNYLVTLLYLAQELNRAAGIPKKYSLESLKPLIQGTLNNIETYGIPSALTGPIARGDLKTVKNHIKEIKNKLPDMLNVYNVLGDYTIKLAKDKGDIDEELVKKLKQILKAS
ncbi:DUF2520 domain-containing protein [Candidatus Magnetomoraceae bacterium gMMP-1]